MSLSERLARIEAKQDGLKETMDRFIVAQEAHNKNHYATKDKVTKIEAKAGTISAFISAIIGGGAAFIASLFRA